MVFLAMAFLAFAWAQARRKFLDVHVATKSPLAGEALARIGPLFEVQAASVAIPPNTADASARGESAPSSTPSTHG